jgi:hypothetical protein
MPPLPVPSWCDVTLGFGADSGTDGDTVAHILRVLQGLTVNVTDAAGAARDLLVVGVEQDDDPAAGWPCFLVGHPLDADDAPTSERVRVALSGARVVVY